MTMATSATNEPVQASSATWRGTLAAGFALGFAAVAVRLAWVGDDAYITLRSVENWVQGNGLRWNVGDRVQVFTHPLWMFVLALGRVVTGEVFHAAIWLGVALSTTAVCWLLRAARTPAGLLLVGSCALTAHAFGDYATSGLETSLTALLLVAFAAIASAAPRPRHWFATTLLAALLVTNRMDLALVCAPGALAAMHGLSWRVRIGLGLLGTLPFVAWLAFASLYYGSPLPVTAHAKMFGRGIAADELLVQGLRYVWQACTNDPVLPATILIGLGLGLRDRGSRWLALGILLHLAYVVKIGGDFMQGRFLLPPFVLALWFVARAARVPPVLLAVPLLGALWAPPHWWRAPTEDRLPPGQPSAVHGIVDERVFYYAGHGLLSPLRRGEPEWGAMNRAEIVWGGTRTTPWLALGNATGVLGYTAGTLGTIVDPLLCDPLLARLPAFSPEHWLIGHVPRRLPEGYLESLWTGENRIVHPGLRRYYAALRTITTAPVFDGERLRTLLAMWRGDFDGDLAAFVAEQYRTPPRLEVSAGDAAAPVATGAWWFDAPAVQLVLAGGVAVRLPASVTCRSLRVALAGPGPFRFSFHRDGVETAHVEATPPGNAIERQRLQFVEVPVPPTAGTFDTLWIDALPGDSPHTAAAPPAFGALELLH